MHAVFSIGQITQEHIGRRADYFAKTLALEWDENNHETLVMPTLPIENMSQVIEF
jgi:hypothetical protein